MKPIAGTISDAIGILALVLFFSFFDLSLESTIEHNQAAAVEAARDDAFGEGMDYICAKLENAHALARCWGKTYSRGITKNARK